MDIDFDFAGEAVVTPVRGSEEDPHRTQDLFVAFAKKYCGKQHHEKWLEKWLKRPNTAFGGDSPEELIKIGRLGDVKLFLQRATRGSN